jgi:hypothetical protein
MTTRVPREAPRWGACLPGGGVRIRFHNRDHQVAFAGGERGAPGEPTKRTAVPSVRPQWGFVVQCTATM